MWAVHGYKVCRVHGANPKNHGGAPIKHGLYSKKASEEVREAMAAAQGLVDLEEELVLLRSRLATWVEHIDGSEAPTLDSEQLERVAKIIGRIESLVKTMAELKLVSEAGKPEGVLIIVGAMGAVIREYVPQAKWQEALDRLERVIHGTSDGGT